jgi:hypothetical protein
MVQLHKKFQDSEVKELLRRYIQKGIKRQYVQQILGIGRSRFFELLDEYRSNPDSFSVQYERTLKTRTIAPVIEENIIKELKLDKKLIADKDITLQSYNYSYIKDRLDAKYNQIVSLPTIIKRAKKFGFYDPQPKRKAHDRMVLTNHIGELIQHDSSVHKWSPYVEEKWYLITTIDDYSRFMFYAKLLSHESVWVHIEALEAVFLTYGLPLSYYVDCHSIFRFVRGRDELHYEHHLLTDEADPQWKQVLDDCNVEVKYALSPQAKGKIERPYRWLQDRLVRTCAREHVVDIKHGNRILDQEMNRYNYRQVHSTTGEIPYQRFQRAMKEKLSLFREFSIKPPFLSTKDIFCLRLNRTADAYRQISINNVHLKVNNLNSYEPVNLRVYPLNSTFSEVRFWANGILLDVQKLKNNTLKTVHF